MNTIKKCFLYTIPLFMVACGGNNDADINSGKDDLRAELKQDELNANKIIRFDKSLFSIPSPFQTSILIQKLGAKYSKKILSSPTNASKYTTTYEKALNLGVYGSDLSYAIIYDQPQDAITYLSSVNKLGNDIGISNAFDKKLLNRIEKNIGHKDSLIQIISLSFKESDAYLKRNDQKLSSTLMLVGGWVEGVYIATKVYNEKPHPEIAKRIGEQKSSLENLLHLLIPLKKEDASIEKLIVDLENLSILYNEVKNTYEFVDASTNEAKKITYVNSKSNLEISKSVLDKITSQVALIRTKIINGNV